MRGVSAHGARAQQPMPGALEMRVRRARGRVSAGAWDRSETTDQNANARRRGRGRGAPVRPRAHTTRASCDRYVTVIGRPDTISSRESRSIFFLACRRAGARSVTDRSRPAHAARGRSRGHGPAAVGHR